MGKLPGLLAATALWAIQAPIAHAQYQGNPLANALGGMLRSAQIAAAKNAWDAYDPYIVQCINTYHSPNVPTLISRGIMPNDYRLAAIIQSCQQRIMAERRQQELQAETARRQQELEAEANAKRAAAAQTEKANREAAEAAERARLQAEKASAEENAAQQEKISAQFVGFQTKAVNPSDTVASLLNYTTFGSNAGSPDSFWSKKDGSSSVYVEYRKGGTLQDPVETVTELDVAKLDPSKFYVRTEQESVVVSFDQTVFARCQTCKREDVQSRWLEFFESRER